MLKRLTAGLFCSSALVGGCANLPPVLTSAVVAFGQELIGTASANYAPEYAQSLNHLLLSVAELATGAPFAQGGATGQYGGYNDGYSTPTYDAAGSTVFDGTQAQYPSTSETYPEDTQYPDAAQYPDTSQYPDTTQYPGTAQYPDTGQYPNTAQYPDTSQYPATTPYPGTAQNPGTSQYPSTTQYPSAAPPTYMTAPTMEAALLAQTVTSTGQISLRPVQDGEALRDGGENPAAGDKIKLSFQANCNCYLYVIGIDATGWVTQMHPEPHRASIPLNANQSYLLPAGSEWWGLDNYKGVEHIYFVLSRTQRFDLEQTLSTLPLNRPSPGSDYQAVTQPALLATRGLVKVQAAAPTTVATSYGQTQSLVADNFSSQLQTGDLVVTRWFHHQ